MVGDPKAGLLNHCDRAFDFELVANSVDQLIDRKRLLHKVVSAGCAKIRNLVRFDHTGDAQDLYRIHRAIRPNTLAYFPTVDVWEHDVQDDQVRAKFLDLHPGVKAVVGGSDFEATVAFESISHQIYQILIVIDDQQFLSTAFQCIGWNAVVFHEDEQMIAWNPTKPASRNSEALQCSVVETTDDRLLADFANLCSLACREDCFCIGHGTQPSLLNIQPKSACQVYPVTLTRFAGLTNLALAWAENSEP